MPVYDIELIDDLSCQEFAYRVEGRNKKAAQEHACSRADPERLPTEPAHPNKRKRPLRCKRISRLTEGETQAWYCSRLKGEGRWSEAQQFIKDARCRLITEHPAWDSRRLTNKAWRAMMAAFPADGSLEPAQRERKQANEANASRMRNLEASGPDGRFQAELLIAAQANSDRGGIQDDVEWVYQNLDIAWPDIVLTTVPSRGSVALLGQAKQDKKWFLQTYHAKLLPTKARIEAGEWAQADDGQIADMCARLAEDAALEVDAV